MDPLSVAASAAGLAGLAVKLGVSISDCVEKVKTADDVLRVFHAELDLFANTLSSINDVLKRPTLTHALGKVASPQDANTQLVSIERVLKDCGAALNGLDALLRAVSSGRLASGIFRKPVAAWRLSNTAPELGRIRDLVKTYSSAIQIHLGLLHFIVQVDATPTIQSIDKALADIRHDILTLRFNDQKHSEPANAAAERLADTAAAIQQSLASSESLLSSASIYVGSTAGTIHDDASVVEVGPQDRGQIHEWIQKSHGDTSSATDPSARDDVDTALISQFALLGQEHFDQGDMQTACRFFSKFLDRAGASGDWNSSEIVAIELKLALAYAFLSHFKSALQTLSSINHASCSQEQLIQVNLSSSEIYLRAGSDIDSARKHARSAMRDGSHGPDRDAYFNSVSLLVEISKLSREDDEAAAYSRLLPREFNPTRILRVPSLGRSIPTMIRPSRQVDGLALSPDGTRLLAYSFNTVCLLDTCTGREVWIFQTSFVVGTISYSFDGSKIAVGAWSDLHILDACLGAEIQSIKYSIGLFTGERLPYQSSLAFSHNALQIASGGAKREVRIWDSHEGTLQHRLRGHSGFITQVRWSTNDTRIVSGAVDGTIRVWDATSGLQLRKFESINPEGLFSLSGHRVLFVLRDSELRVGGITSGVTELVRSKGKDTLEFAAFSRDERRFMYVGDGWETIAIWDIASGKSVQLIETSGKRIRCLASTQNRQHIAYTLHGETDIRVVNVRKWMG